MWVEILVECQPFWNYRIFSQITFFFQLLLCTGASLAPGNEDECKREGGFCGFLTCYHPDHIFGRCSVFMVCCKR